MAIVLCRKCGHCREVRNHYTGASIHCPRCGQPTAVHDTVMLVERIFKAYQATSKALRELTGDHAPEHGKDSAATEQLLPADIDIQNTSALANPKQYTPILAWFKARGIGVDVNHKAMDTTGFFDDVAVHLGDHYDTLKLVSDNIKYVQNRGYSNVKLALSKHSQKQTATITRFCRELHEYSFVAKYFYHKRDRIVRLMLQSTPSISRFFNGEWMEWFVFMKLFRFFQSRQIPVACMRSFSVTFRNEDVHEIDVFFLINNTLPLCIECKTGEFRQDIGQYSNLVRRLSLDKTQFVVCVIGLSEQQVLGFNSMYNVTFANEVNFIQSVERLLR